MKTHLLIGKIPPKEGFVKLQDAYSLFFLLSKENGVEVATLLERVRNAKEYIHIGIDAKDYYKIKDSEENKE